MRICRICARCQYRPPFSQGTGTAKRVRYYETMTIPFWANLQGDAFACNEKNNMLARIRATCTAYVASSLST